MPLPHGSIQDDAYAQLIGLLHPSRAVVLEIEILPSSFPPQILHESSAVGVPSSLLKLLYLEARQTFFDHASSRDPDVYHAALQATAILLLFDPNHLTAANFRKQHVQRLSDRWTENDLKDPHAEDLTEAVRDELTFVRSLVASPLSKHAKSSTLWAQRLWIVQNYFQPAMRTYGADEAMRTMSKRDCMRRFWDEEMVIVMKAGERHPRNYYAWQYARLLISFLHSERCEIGRESDWERELLRDSMRLVHGWCSMHPRDISGWAFLVFLLEQLRHEGCNKKEKGQRLKDEIRMLASKTKQFARKYEWKGESVEWVLKAVETLIIDDWSTEKLTDTLQAV